MPFTCLSCAIAFVSAHDQRDHYRSDHHRYNIKRRVAGLPPVTAAVFSQKLSEHTQDVPTQTVSRCDPCGKTYATENAYRSHLNSKKHTENVHNAPSRQPQPTPSPDEPQISSTSCLFCTATATSLQDNLSHMSSTHSFFIPDAEYLVDITGLINYLAEKIAVGNVCIYCNGKGRELHTLDAVRKHMIDKSHCKIAYDTEIDKLEISDYYDFTSSYAPDANTDDHDWEDVDGSEGGDSEGSERLPDNQLKYGDTEYELVLPSGARIGHRSMMRYYAQSFHGIHVQPQDPNSGAALVRRLLADKNSALVPSKGGFGAFGQGTQVVKARNKGEAREAGRHIREFRDQRRREDFKTKVGFIHNSQKHFRDPLLQ
ncbi:C2H2 type zinc-finger-domain-containing protein [Boletus edulis BED1]|uniref:C2H2 type zinc-finger-domain-containing protein n=1 Tax=Boletus edulis BED1 TaxID=1328754 RepID=A0AAD4BZG9_BOLED|nr:C2H2 type zinc-finger-domain-containing protein [Boletus edulis BED1]